jgi:uncharacterized membrane protein YhaH (DUF805 family)
MLAGDKQMHWSQIFWPKARTNRAPYWVLNFIGNGTFSVIERLLPNPTAVQDILTGILGLVIAYIGACLAIGRLHDLDRSGWWALAFIPVVVIFGLLGAFPELKDPLFRDGGPLMFATIATLVVTFAAGVYLGFARGTPGTNGFGPSPISYSPVK